MLPALLLLISACSVESAVSPASLPREVRRAVLEDALWLPSLPYSRKLLSAYGMESQGWELLPLMDERVAPFRRADGERLARGDALITSDLRPIRELGLSLGHAVFHYLPMRGDSWLDWLAASPEHWEEVGLRVTQDGQLKGLVRHIDALGRPSVAVTCALCHSAETTHESFHDGRGSRTLDLGFARTLWRAAHGLGPGAEAQWGPGRLDVTDDGVDGPTVIPDLFGLKHAQYLNCSGVIEVTHDAVPAIRFETQYILGHEMLARPARDLTTSLADYVMSLEAKTAPTAPPAAFLNHCAGCHDPNAGFSGGLVEAELVGTDTIAAFTPSRGTGYYKASSLLGVSLGGPYFHDGSAESLEAALAQHTPAARLSAVERASIIDFLSTL